MIAEESDVAEGGGERVYAMKQIRRGGHGIVRCHAECNLSGSQKVEQWISDPSTVADLDYVPAIGGKIRKECFETSHEILPCTVFLRILPFCNVRKLKEERPSLPLQWL
jgi:hypothetical protein